MWSEAQEQELAELTEGVRQLQRRYSQLLQYSNLVARALKRMSLAEGSGGEHPPTGLV